MKRQKSTTFARFIYKYINDKNYCKVSNHCHYTGKYRSGSHKICNLQYSILKGILVVFCNGSNYDYYPNIYERAKVFQG